MKKVRSVLALMLIFVLAVVCQIPCQSVMAATTIVSNVGAPYLSYVESPAGSGQYVATLNLKPAGYIQYKKVRFEFTFDTVATGWLVDIGDSSTNDGWGADAGTQSNDAEFDIKDTEAAAYYNDYGTGANIEAGIAEPSIMFKKMNTGHANSTQVVEISDNTVSYSRNNPTYSITRTTAPNNYSFALNNQADSEGGSPNYTMYLGINRVISPVNGTAYRTGSGVKSVKIYFLDPVF